MVLCGVGRLLLIGGIVVNESLHLLMVCALVHDDSRSALIGWVDGDGFILLQVFDCHFFLARDVGWRDLTVLQDL